MEHILPRSTALREAVERTKHSELSTHALLTVTEACAYLRISKWSLYRRIQANELQTVKIGRRRLIPMRSILHFIEQLEQASGA